MNFEEARIKYKPDKIKYLLIAEAPPKEESNRFFYFEDVSKGDNLFLETMKVLYPDEFISPPWVRVHKKEFLEKFKQDGFYLVDSVEYSISSNKKQEIKKNLPKLVNKVKNLIDNETRVILISATVFEVCSEPLRTAGVKLANIEMIDFPGSGGQKKFREKLASLF